LGWPNVAIVTASHNPGRYNGVKFLLAGEPAKRDLIAELEQGLAQPPAPTAGNLDHRDILPLYERDVVAVARGLCPESPPTTTSGPRLRVVVDAMGGTMTEVAPRVLEAAGNEVISACPQFDPEFRHRTPNPADDDNLVELTRRVPAEGADAGIAFDGDGDRVILVDHTGCIVRPEQIGCLLAKHCFERPTVVYDLKCASVLPRAVAECGGTPLVSPSGYGFIRRTMVDRQADFGLEASGHHFYRVLGGGDDGLLTALLVLELLQLAGLRLAQWRQATGWPAITPDVRVPFAGDAGRAIERIAETCGGRVSRLDGVRAEYDDGWALARPSITEPVITLRFEGRDQAHVPVLVQRFLNAAPELRDQVLEKIQHS
jgi:phosphomannomutase/phosphoglucomutase